MVRYDGGMRKPTSSLPMSPDQRRTLEAWVRAQNTPQSVALRARIVLLSADGLPNSRIAREVGVSRPTVILWRERFRQGGPDGLTKIAPGRGRPVTYNADRVKQIIEATTQSKPPGATHWSTRTMAKAQGVSKATVQRIWFAHGLQPHRTKRFKLSKDPHFTEKLTEKRVRRGSFESVPELIAAIEQYLAASNADPKPFVWHTSAQAILAKLAKCKATYETLD